jgi:GNAT superfamily N-acetyltransferase
MAMQNAVQRVHFASMPPTTLMTGNITQAVIDAGDLIWKFEPIDAAAVRARLVRTLRGIISFAAGCALAALLYYWFGFWCLAVPVAVGALTAILTEHVPADATTIRLCRDDERDEILSIINAAAEAYRGVIPADRWHEPYMPGDALDRERAAGVVFWGYQDRGRLTGVMGLQDVGDVNLIRHAYVLPAQQRAGIGGRLLKHLQQMSTKPMLVGTWAAATWAIRFYERHGFALVSPQRKTALLKSYWTIPERQIETSVVLANPPDLG